MGRWPLDSTARLKACALQLFAERGFAAVTAAEIAAAAGMSERTFFRHFRAKEDVLFEDHMRTGDALSDVVASAPAGDALSAMRAVASLLADRFEAQREEIRLYARVVAAEPALRAREALRDRDWSLAIAQGFTRRGFAPQTATLLGALTGAVFRVVVDAWLADRAGEGLTLRFEAAIGALAAQLKDAEAAPQGPS